MNGKKLETEIGDWAASLGFSLPNGSAPPPNYFATLTATPHRRQLWEVIIESVRPRQKVQNMRKQLLVLNLREENKNFNHKNKQLLGRMKLLMRQRELEEEIIEKNKTVVELEKKILTEASDLVFDVCKLAELEKHCNEYKEKMLALKLFDKREKLCLEVLEKMMSCSKDLNRVTSSNQHNEALMQEKVSEFENEQFSPKSCKESTRLFHDCTIQSKIKNLCDSGVTEACLWEKVLTSKKIQFEKFSNFLLELNSIKRDLLLEREATVEKILKSSMTKLKQDVTLKSLQLMINESEGHFLNAEVENLMEKIKMLTFKSSPDKSLSENGSFLGKEIDGQSFSRKSKSFPCHQLNNHLINLELMNYRNFLEAELFRLESEEMKNKKIAKELKTGEDVLKESLSAIDTIHNEIMILNSEQSEQTKEINRLRDRLKELSKEISDEIEDEDFVEEVNGIVEEFKTYSEKQIKLFLEIPLDALKTVEDSSGGKSFACESLSQFLNKCGGEFKQFFKSILIHPQQSLESAQREIGKRQKTAEDIKKFISEREKLSEDQKMIFSRLNSVQYDSEKCEKNFQNSNEILSNVLFKAMKLHLEIEFAQKILKNWVEQPYRHMIKEIETVEGYTMKEFQEMYKKNQSKKSSK